MNRDHPRAEPELERLEEPDKTPMKELSDPAAGVRHRGVASDRPLRAEPAKTTRAASAESPTAARVVGECLTDGSLEQSIAGREAVTGRGSVLNVCGQGLSITCGEGRALADPGPGTRHHAAARTNTAYDPVSCRDRARMPVSSRLEVPSGRACLRSSGRVSGARCARATANMPAATSDQVLVRAS